MAWEDLDSELAEMFSSPGVFSLAYASGRTRKNADGYCIRPLPKFSRDRGVVSEAERSAYIPMTRAQKVQRERERRAARSPAQAAADREFDRQAHRNARAVEAADRRQKRLAKMREYTKAWKQRKREQSCSV